MTEIVMRDGVMRDAWHVSPHFQEATAPLIFKQGYR